MAVDLEAAVTTVAAALAVGTDPAASEDRGPVDSAGQDPADLDTIPIIPRWADGIGMDLGGTMLAVAAWAG